MSNKQSTTPNLTKARWAHIKALRVGRGDMVHQSAEVAMLPNKGGAHLPRIPWIQRPGITYDVGRNKAKRERRAMFGVRK